MCFGGSPKVDAPAQLPPPAPAPLPAPDPLKVADPTGNAQNAKKLGTSALRIDRTSPASALGPSGLAIPVG